jgi:3-isopropylmalate/(R)-2-methylmalate dehydratase large subunit
MGLRVGQRIDPVPFDQALIGSCTDARVEDLRAAAAVLRGRRARLPGLVSPGLEAVRARARAEGLDVVFREAGAAPRLSA